jgi:tRNA dimethylallyltransferase
MGKSKPKAKAKAKPKKSAKRRAARRHSRAALKVAVNEAGPVIAQLIEQPEATRHPSPVTRHSTKSPPAILLMGPTASGKTAVAARLVTELPCEIISVDSAQIYKGMDIGTGKPDAALLRKAPHHLLDVIEPHESYSAARFRDDALTLMREITERDRIPLLVGGTMLYFKALTEGPDEQGWPAVHDRLAKVDPETAARLQPNDSQRIQRALEVYYLTNKPMSELLKKPKYVYFPYTPIKISLVPSDRDVLHMRIAQRFDGMLKAGLVRELKGLRDEYGLDTGMPSMRCVGYRQAWDHLEGRIDAAALREQGIAATRQLAKHQLTWLRGMDDVTEFDCLAEDVSDLVLEYIRRELEAQLVS